MIARDSVGDERESRAIELSSPLAAIRACAELHGLVDFRVGIGFVLAFIPSPSCEDTHPIGKRLLDVHTETVLRGRLQWMSCNVRSGRPAREEIGNRHAVDAHVRVVRVAQYAQHRLSLWHKRMV